MAFNEYRDPGKTRIAHEFDIERFAYDVFAYILRICGIPKEKIPTSSRKENIYIEDNFVMNVGLSALPISLYMRDEWKTAFETVCGESGKHDVLEIQNYLEFILIYSGELEEEDMLSKIQYSLAMYNEFFLFCHYKGIETDFDSLPKLWSHLCKELIAESEDFNETLDSSFIMCPDVPESWIAHFIRNFAIPYGSSDDISNRFSLYTLECHSENDTFPEESPSERVTDGTPKELVDQPSEISDEDTLPESVDSEVNITQGLGNIQACSTQLQIPEEHALRKPIGHHRYKNGLTYVLQQCLKGRKRNRSPKLEVEDAIGKMNLEKENISPENRDTKRRRKISVKKTIE